MPSPEALLAPTDAGDQSRSYGAQFAGVYDRLFPAVTDTARTVRFLERLVGPGGSALELGVGTGRVAVPLAATGVRVTGLDSSAEMLACARRNAGAAGVSVDLVEADIRTWRAPERVDLVLCLCATLSMFAEEDEQVAVLERAAEAVRPGGAIVVETHSPAPIRRLHEQNGPLATLAMEVPGLPGGVRTTAQLSPDGRRWDVAHQWSDDGQLRSAYEFSRLTAPADLDRLATRAGLVAQLPAVDWSGAPAGALDPTYVSVFVHPAPVPRPAPGAAPPTAARPSWPNGPRP